LPHYNPLPPAHAQSLIELGSVDFGPGIFNQSSDFSGYGSGDQVRVYGLSDEVVNLQEPSIGTWVKLDPSGPADAVQRFMTLSREKAVLHQEGWGPGATNQMLHFSMHFPPYTTPISLSHIHVDNPFHAGCYHFVVGTYGEDDYMRAYLDGVEVGTNYVPDGEVAASYGFAAFGCTGGGPNPISEELTGSLDELFACPRALTPTEIQEIYQIGPASEKCAQALGSISGEVTVEGTGLAGLTVTLTGPSTQTAATASGGYYSFGNLHPGEYTVEVSGFTEEVGFDPTAESVVVPPNGEPVTVDFAGDYVRTASIAGQVLVDGYPVPGVAVEIQGPDPWIETMTTGSGGNFGFINLRAGTYDV
jgi:hypothetical protein